MAKKESNSRFGEVKSSRVKFHSGEPIFVVRGSDPFATGTIIEYARRCEREGAAREVVDEVFDLAMRVAEWQRQHPDLVTPLPE